MTYLDAAYTILQAAGQPLHYEEITQRALDQKLISEFVKISLWVVIGGEEGWSPLSCQVEVKRVELGTAT